MAGSFAPAFPDAATVAAQAGMVRALYPELFAALDARDRQLQRTLRRIPHPDDAESWLPPHQLEQALSALRALGGGIGDLCDATR